MVINWGPLKSKFWLLKNIFYLHGSLTPLSRQFLASLNWFSSNSPNLIRLPSSSINRHRKLHHAWTNMILFLHTVGRVMDVSEWLNGTRVSLGHEYLLIALWPCVTVEKTLFHVANDMPRNSDHSNTKKYNTLSWKDIGKFPDSAHHKWCLLASQDGKARNMFNTLKKFVTQRIYRWSIYSTRTCTLCIFYMIVLNMYLSSPTHCWHGRRDERL